LNKITAIVYEDIPSFRTLMLKGSANDPELDTSKIYLKLAEKGTDPDMISTKSLKAGDEVSVTIKGSSVWRATLSEDTPAGTLVSCDGDGKIRWTQVGEHARYIGYSLENGKAGDVIHFARKTGTVGTVIGTDMEDMTDNGKEI